MQPKESHHSATKRERVRHCQRARAEEESEERKRSRAEQEMGLTAAAPKTSVEYSENDKFSNIPKLPAWTWFGKPTCGLVLSRKLLFSFFSGAMWWGSTGIALRKHCAAPVKAGIM